MKRLWYLLFVLTPVVGQSIQGIVRERTTLVPLEGAIVRIQKAEAFTTSAVDGSFQINASVGDLITAAKLDYYNGFVQVTAEGQTLFIEMDPIPTNIVPDHPLNQPDTCSICHPQQHFEWFDSPMAKTGLNKWVFDVYDGQGTAGGMNGFVYQRDSVHRFASPNSDCSACHSPVHWLTDIQNAGMGNIHSPTVDMELGVQCEVCHRAYAVDPDKSNFPGVKPESFTFLRGPDPVEFGLLGDSIFEQEIMRPAYNPLLSARLCSACHEDNVDHDDDGDFEDEGSVPHEMTFSEWEQYRTLVGSENAQSCIGCHMPVTDEGQFCIWEQEPRRPGTIRLHDIRGTTPDFLENAVTMSAGHDQTFNTVSVQVSIENDLTGHAVPTGVVIRNMLLVVEARGDGSQPLTQVSGDQVDVIGGVGDPADGYYAGLAGKSFYLNMVDQDGNEGIFYTEAVGIASDTRIMPGATYSGAFTFDLGPTPPKNVSVDARLIYRRAYRALVDQKNWTLTGHDEPLADIQPPHFGHLMERAQFQVDICAVKDVNGSATIDIDDLRDLNPLWGQPAPFCAESDPITNIKHFVSLVNCL